MLRYLVFFCIVVALTFSGMRTETSNFTTSRERNTSIALAIHAFGTKLLELLDLNNVTNATNISFPKVPEYVSSRLMADAEMTSDNVLSDDDESNMNKNTFTIYKPCNEYSSVYYINKSDSVFFSMPEMLAHQRVKSAKLMFYINAGNLTKHYLSLKVRRILLDNGVVQPRLVHSFTFLKSDAFGWKQIDVKDIVNDWQYHPLVEIGLQIEAKNEEGRNLVVLPADNFDKSYEPSLQIEVNKETSHSRHRRQISSPCLDLQCCMYPYTIDLIETIGRLRGLEVVLPEMLELNYCHGECFLKRYDDFYYSSLLINTQLVEKPCCVPTKYKEMRVLFFVENQFADLTFPEAIVESCGCM